MRRLDSGDESGYTLVGLMVVVAVVNVSLAVAVTSVRIVGQRAREAELIWRGQQIARAVGCHERANAGQPLIRLEQLVEADCLRRVYRDPMARDGEWRILRQQDVADGTIALLLGVEVDNDGAATGLASGGLRGRGSPGLTGLAPGGVAQGQQQSTAASGLGGARPGRSSLRLASAGVGAANSIVGVVSHSTEASLRAYGDKTKYSQWVFLGGQAGAATTPAGGGRAALAQSLNPQR